MPTDPIAELAERWTRLGQAAAHLHAQTLRDQAEARALSESEAARHGQATTAIRARLHDVLAAAAGEHRARETAARAEHAERMKSLEVKAKSTVEEILRRAETDEARVKEAYQHALWMGETVYEASENASRLEHEERRAQIQTYLQQLEELIQEASRQTRRYRQRPPAIPDGASAAANETALIQLPLQVAAAREMVHGLRRLPLPGLYRGPILLVPALLLAGAAAIGAFLAGMRDPVMVGLGAGAGFGLVAVLAVALWFVARGQVHRVWRPLGEMAAQVRGLASAALDFAAQDRERQVHKAKEKLQRERAAAHAKFRPLLESVESKRGSRQSELESVVPERRSRYQADLDAALTQARETRDRVKHEAEALAAAETATEQARHAAARKSIEGAGEDAHDQRLHAWCHERDAFLAWTRGLTQSGDQVAMDLAQVTPDPGVFPAHLLVGRVTLDASSLPHGVPQADGARWPAEHRWSLPLLRPLPEAPSLLVEAPVDRRAEALAALQAAAARLLLQSPPGKVRLTLIDPVGLGQGFAGFMHLADQMEQLVGERIWTEPRHIEQKLTDLTEHMETVIQKYLRDEFPTIADYNAQAGQLAEPLRVLVMADFPAGLNEAAVRRLGSILQSGARCGVHLLLLRDPARPMPDGLGEADVLRTCRRIRWHDGAFRADMAGLEGAAVGLDAPPSPARLQELLRVVGERARTASVVQVPFSAIEPTTDRFWTGSTAGSLSVPIGRTGATQLQSLVLGEGTRQHVLVAGKTGSGKSTLLNAIIVNLASWFSPQELELWLIDFKKGVEFKAYAAHGLPHARAVAVESDREFGLSVLQGLDAELKRRGDLFRAAGVQDLGAWRRLGRPDPMPRALLIVDEFQELFVEEDKVAQESALLLDRLVRQGRAFGMHVILGSQTLGGAYALPRTTMGQMGVRIAMQCNEADAALILSDDNTAARLLSRPGEAIYNDAGGLVEGNSPFQVVWLGDQERERRVQALAERGRPTAASRPAMIVFDGTSKASMARCRPLRARVTGPALALPLHLGEPVAIREATVANLRRQSGANMLVVGQEERMSLGISMAVLASVRASGGPGARVILLDGTPADAPEAGQLAAMCASLELDASVPGYREVDEAVTRLGAEVLRRTESGRSDEPPILLLVHGLQRFRSLRRNEDDFSFGSGDGPPKPDRVLAAILRDGPAVGVHAVLGVDTATSLQRTIDRGGMRDFDLRVLMQMGANDSSGLIDSPAASRLGAERALLFSEERGTLERFRPFEPADADELAALRGPG
ncbi:MAG: cell division protein FtsK [Planctomycetes bacterium]|nr:cell division protein FtsK [Planctomycetota bacterium]